ncbi:hypothetical protein FRC06_009748 [Ceratobasidium sp. 370]|nr:hypothetical protein FRC06_009748 [Ceratobasidium sp. 370]
MNPSAPALLPELWTAHQALAILIDKRPSVNHSQWKTLRDQLKIAIISAETCCSQRAGLSEINRLSQILYSTHQYLLANRDVDWTAAVYGPDQFVSSKARELDEVLQGFAPITRGTFQSTVKLVEQARAEDRAWMDRFVAGVDRVTPAPGGFAQAFRDGNVNELNTLTDRVLNEQSQILSAPADLQEEDVRNARDLTNWIMNLTGKRPGPGVLLGQRFVTGETVVIKALRDRLVGRDNTTQIRKFQKHVEVWHSLRSEYTLPFYGIGKSEQNGLTQIYSVSPYMKNGDAVAYHRNFLVSAAGSLQIALDVAYAVRYLHERRSPVVHFSICTENVLIDDRGRGVLAGFGLIAEASDIPSAYHTGVTNDLYRFIAPEHLTESYPRRTSSDVWSWAMVALHLVGGKKPFADSSDFQAATLASNGHLPNRKDYPRIGEISDPEAFWQLLEKCWARDETQRPPMDEVVIQLRRLSQLDEVPRPLHLRADLPSMDGTQEYGRIAPPVVQPRRH